MPRHSAYHQYKELDSPSRICGSHVLSKFLAFKSLKSKSSIRSATSSSCGGSSDFSVVSRDEQYYYNNQFSLRTAGPRNSSVSNSNSGAAATYVLGATQLPRAIGTPPTNSFDCMLFGGSLFAARNKIEDSIKTRSCPMDKISVKRTPVPLPQNVVLLDPLVVHEMKKKYLQNGKYRDSQRRLPVSASTIKPISNNIGCTTEPEKNDSSADTAAIKKDKDLGKDIEWKTIASLVEFVGQENVLEAARLRALEAIHRIVQERQQKLDVVSSCSDRRKEKLSYSKKTGEDTIGRDSNSTVGREAIAELIRETDYCRSESVALREEMESIRREFDIVRYFLPSLHSDKLTSLNRCEVDEMGRDERFNVGDDPFHHGVQNELSFSFETEGDFGRTKNIGNCDSDDQYNVYAREDARMKHHNRPHCGNGKITHVTKGQAKEDSNMKHLTYRVAHGGSVLEGNGSYESIEHRGRGEVHDSFSRDSPRQPKQYCDMTGLNGDPLECFDRIVRVGRTKNSAFTKATQNGSHSWNSLSEDNISAELG